MANDRFPPNGPGGPVTLGDDGGHLALPDGTFIVGGVAWARLRYAERFCGYKDPSWARGHDADISKAYLKANK